MALGFIKKIFTFGKDPAAEPKPEAEAPAAEQQVLETPAAAPTPGEIAATPIPPAGCRAGKRRKC